MGQKIQKLRIASYNIRKAVGLDRRRDPGRIVEVINGLGADVVALQEADRRLGQRRAALPRSLIEAHTDFEILPLATNDVSLGWHGNAILLRKGIVAKAPGRVELPSLEPRGAVRVTLEGAVPVTVVATHLGLSRRHRRRQLASVARDVAADGPVVILGDFNEWSRDRGLEALAGYEVIAPGATFHAARPVAALDRIALGAGLACEDAGVQEGGLARLASDHLPIWADVRVMGGPA